MNSILLHYRKEAALRQREVTWKLSFPFLPTFITVDNTLITVAGHRDVLMRIIYYIMNKGVLFIGENTISELLNFKRDVRKIK